MMILNALLLPCLYAALASLGFGIFFELRGRKLLAAAIAGGFGWLGYLLTPGGDIAQYFGATVAIALYAEVLARIQHAPVTVYLAPALIPLVPGAGIYQTMLYALNGQTDLSLETGLHTLAVAGALAIGLVVASSVLRLIFLRLFPR